MVNPVAIPSRGSIFAGATAGCQFGTVIRGHVSGIHVGDAQESPVEHALPFPLDNVFTVVGPQ